MTLNISEKVRKRDAWLLGCKA